MISVKPITPATVASLRAVRLAALQESPLAFASTFARESQMSEADWLQRVSIWNGERSVCNLAWQGEQPCGIVAGYLDREQANCAHLAAMWVAPPVRRLGVGRLLVRSVIDWAAGLGVEMLHLTVTSNNDSAKRLYESLGFRKSGKVEPYANDPALAQWEMVREIHPPTSMHTLKDATE